MSRVQGSLDRREADANTILANPADESIVPCAEDLRELIVEMQAKVDEKLERASDPR
jgi:hypothetical protein